MKYGKVTLGQVEAVWNRLGGEKGVQAFLDGKSEVLARKHVIDCMALPSIPHGFSIALHRQAKPLEWDLESIQLRLYNSKETYREIYVQAYPTVLNANVADYLLAHQHLIPDSWVGRHIYFFGTAYQYNGPDDLYVQTIHWSPSEGERGKWTPYIDKIDSREWPAGPCVAIASHNLEPI